MSAVFLQELQGNMAHMDQTYGEMKRWKWNRDEKWLEGGEVKLGLITSSSYSVCAPFCLVLNNRQPLESGVNVKPGTWMRNLHWDTVNHYQAGFSALCSFPLDSNVSHMLERWGHGNNGIVELQRGNGGGEKREKSTKLRGHTGKDNTIKSNQITFIFTVVYFYQVVCHVRLKSTLSPVLF